MSDINEKAVLIDAKKRKAVATIVLNGYNIRGGGPLGQSGAMRSFKVVRGDLFQQWSTQEQLVLRSEAGQAFPVRIAALPVDDDSSGLVEFL